MYFLLVCGPPNVTTIANGSLIFNASITTYSINSTLNYTCDPGFEYDGPLVTTCEDDLMWTLDSGPPECTES